MSLCGNLEKRPSAAKAVFILCHLRHDGSRALTKTKVATQTSLPLPPVFFRKDINPKGLGGSVYILGTEVGFRGGRAHRNDVF
jgi:hypothetical protein